MKEPIKAGDRCRVIDGVLREKSPNVGKEVVVRSLQGNHSTLGVIWRCTGPDLVTFNDMKPEGGAADFPAIWLKKLDPEASPVKKLAETISEPP